MQTLEFHLDSFDGPMDLLMHLLEKNKIDVYDIPINDLTDQYLAYLQQANAMNLEIASHFLLFAAQLVRIKTKMLLPKRRSEEEDEDPRQSLVDQIIAYKLFKELAGELEDLHGEASRYYKRPVDVKALSEKYKKYEPLTGLDVGILLTAFETLESYAKEKSQVMIVEKMGFSIEGLKEALLNYCADSAYPTFQNVLKTCSSTDEMITYFLALLECVRRNELVAVQHELFGEIWLHEVAI